MDAKNIIKSFIIPVFVVSLVLIAGKVYSQTLEISGNASTSDNSVNINQKDSTTVNQSNSVKVNNSVNSNSNTGGNSGEGIITTGNATSNVDINNQFNNNNADVKCEKCLTPTPKPSPKASPTSPQGAPTSTPAPAASGNGGGVGGPGGGEGGQGGAGVSQQAPAVLGLAAASGENTFLQIIPAFMFILLGYGFVKRNV